MSLNANQSNITDEGSTDRSCKTPRWRILKSQLNNYTPAEFKRELERATDPIVLDVRRPDEFATFHLAAAIHINYFDEHFWDEVEKLDNNRPIFVYCRSGRRSIRACTLMNNGGFAKEKIYHLDGGMNAWEEAFGQT